MQLLQWMMHSTKSVAISSRFSYLVPRSRYSRFWRRKLLPLRKKKPFEKISKTLEDSEHLIFPIFVRKSPDSCYRNGIKPDNFTISLLSSKIRLGTLCNTCVLDMPLLCCMYATTLTCSQVKRAWNKQKLSSLLKAWQLHLVTNTRYYQVACAIRTTKHMRLCLMQPDHDRGLRDPCQKNWTTNG